MSQDPNSASYCDDTTIEDDRKACAEREQLERELAAMTAERDALVQTCGELCPHCGWRGLRGDPEQCAFCQNAKLSADLHNMTARAELAERQVEVLCKQIGETGWCPTEQTCQSGKTGCSGCWAAWSRAEAKKGG